MKRKETPRGKKGIVRKGGWRRWGRKCGGMEEMEEKKVLKVVQDVGKKDEVDVGKRGRGVRKGGERRRRKKEREEKKTEEKRREENMYIEDGEGEESIQEDKK